VKQARVEVRMDEEMKDKLDVAADAVGISTASLIRACVRDMLRNGGAYFMLPENMRLTFEEENARTERIQAYWREEMRRRRHRKSVEYMRTRTLPRRSF
jgi:antitoxin component of RelBE/YafQ-DinJ toxin-antitoxin module